MIPLALLWSIWLSGAHADTPVLIWSTDLQADDAGLVPSGDPDQWEWGPVESGPGTGTAGPNAWATRLGSVHMNNADDRLTLPPMSLDGLEQPVLVLTHWYDFEPDGHDFGRVEQWVPDTWTTLAPLSGPPVFEGASDGWQISYLPLDGLSDLNHLRLRFFADASVARDGWVLGSIALVDGDPVPPIVSVLESPSATQDLNGPHPVEILATDNVGVEGVDLIWYAGGGERSTTPMSPLGDGGYAATFPGADPGTDFVWWAEAIDAAGNVGIATGPTFRVYLPAPEDLIAPEGRWVDTTVPLSWSAPDSIWPIVRYTVYRNGEAVATSVEPSTTAPVSGPRDSFHVVATFDTENGLLDGDPSAPRAVEAYPPTILRVSPASAWPGDTLIVEVVGRYLRLTADELVVALGTGVEVTAVEVLDADTARIGIEVDADTSPGIRTITLAGRDWAVSAEGAFEVRSDTSRPRIRAIEPTRLIRGTRENLIVRTNVTLPDDLRLDLGTGIVVESARRVDQDTARFIVSTANDAPLETRQPELDIGTRLLPGPPVEVRAPLPKSNTRCATVDGRSHWMWCLLVVVGLGRRRSPFRWPDLG